MTTLTVKVNLTKWEECRAFGETAEQFIKRMQGNISNIEKNGLKADKESLERELKGIGKENWCKANHIPADEADKEWNHKIEWRMDSIKHTERKIRRYRKEIAKAEAFIKA